MRKLLIIIHTILGGLLGFCASLLILLLVSLSVDTEVINEQTYEIISASNYDNTSQVNSKNWYLIEYIDENCDTIRANVNATIDENVDGLKVVTLKHLYESYHEHVYNDTIKKYTLGNCKIKSYE